MSDEATNKPARPKRSTKDRWIKIGFAAVALVAIVLIYRRQTSPPRWVDNEDLAGALRDGRSQKRPVLVLFCRRTPGEIARRLMQSTLARKENRAAIEAGRFIRVQVAIGNVDKSELARTYRLKNFPTMLVLGPNGWEYNRREGFIGEVDFRDGFLDCKRISRAGVVGWRNVRSGSDMDGVLSDAREQSRAVLVLFTPAEPDPATRDLYETTLAERANRQAIEDADLILVHVAPADVKASLAAASSRVASTKRRSPAVPAIASMSALTTVCPFRTRARSKSPAAKATCFWSSS